MGTVGGYRGSMGRMAQKVFGVVEGQDGWGGGERG